MSKPAVYIEALAGVLKSRSLALRLALSSAVVGAVVMLVAGGGAYVTLESELLKQDVAALEAKRALIEHLLAKLDAMPTEAQLPHDLADFVKGHDDMSLTIWSNATANTRLQVKREHGRGVSSEGTPKKHVVRHALSTSIDGQVENERGFVVAYQLSLDGERSATLLRGFGRTLAFAIPIMLLLVIVGAWLVAVAGLVPLHRFIAVSNSVSATSLSGRIKLDDLPSEIKQLAENLNEMLLRLELGVGRLSQFSDDLAHEIRTPLANAMGRAQVALSRPRTQDELQVVLAATVDDMERLSRLVSDMLFLARAENEAEALTLSDVDLGAEAQLVVSYLDVIAEEADVSVAVSGQAHVNADRLLVQRAITNLLSNALRHSRRHAQVEVLVTELDDSSVLRVTNQGELIPEDRIPRLVERFYRVDAHRDRKSGGSGMGLAIVAAIMRLHGGTVHAQSVRIESEHSPSHAQTTFELHFPKTTPSWQRSDRPT